tara:strand:+ start:1096 stop:1323 length:228 start_codon:yes stop_codon:yes gene_type:complete
MELEEYSRNMSPVDLERPDYDHLPVNFPDTAHAWRFVDGAVEISLDGKVVEKAVSGEVCVLLVVCKYASILGRYR